MPFAAGQAHHAGVAVLFTFRNIRQPMLHLHSGLRTCEYYRAGHAGAIAHCLVSRPGDGAPWGPARGGHARGLPRTL
jgi:hypothetical protein